jgi:hypothetical protein
LNLPIILLNRYIWRVLNLKHLHLQGVLCRCSGFDTRSISRGQNELIGKFKTTVGDVISFGG